MTDESYLKKALELAEKGRGFVSPNPLVGALVVKDGKIVGSGYHQRFGGPHAEVFALEEADKKAKGATLYVTLEPCTHWGKTPPCVDKIIESKIKRAVISTLDPNPLVQGKGVQRLKNAGIETRVGILRKEAERQNEAYLKFIKKRAPFVNLKIAATLDAKIATQKGESKWITSKISRVLVQKLRLENDAVLVGINTIIRDNPRLNIRILAKKELTRVILDSKLRIPLKSKIFNTPGKIIIFTKDSNPRARVDLKAKILKKRGVEIISVSTVKNGLLAWKEILMELYKRNIQSLLIEGGARVFSSALKSGVVDKVYLFQAPKILGKGLDFASSLLRLKDLNSALRLKDIEIKKIGPDILITGYLK